MEAWKAARIPCARNHDYAYVHMGRCVDIYLIARHLPLFGRNLKQKTLQGYALQGLFSSCFGSGEASPDSWHMGDSYLLVIAA